jgi:hypothetical protein
VLTVIYHEIISMFPSITKRLFIIKEIDTASECSNMAVLGNASATPVISIMLPHSDAVSISFMIKSLFVMDGNIVLKEITILKEYNIYIYGT